MLARLAGKAGARLVVVGDLPWPTPVERDLYVLQSDKLPEVEFRHVLDGTTTRATSLLPGRNLWQIGSVGDPAACLFRVKLQLGSADGAEDRAVVVDRGASRSVTVVAKDAETAIARARERLDRELHHGERARVACVEFIEAIDVL